MAQDLGFGFRVWALGHLKSKGSAMLSDRSWRFEAWDMNGVYGLGLRDYLRNQAARTK